MTQPITPQRLLNDQETVTRKEIYQAFDQAGIPRAEKGRAYQGYIAHYHEKVSREGRHIVWAVTMLAISVIGGLSLILGGYFGAGYSLNHSLCMGLLPCVPLTILSLGATVFTIRRRIQDGRALDDTLGEPQVRREIQKARMRVQVMVSNPESMLVLLKV